MAFEGDLQNISLADIFQTLVTNQQSGTLVVRSQGREKRLAFGSRGVSAISRRTLDGSRLGEFLVGRGLINETDLKLALMQQRQSGYPLGRILVDKEIVPATEVEEVIRYHAVEEIYDLFEWRTGQFEFIEGEVQVIPGESSPFASVHFEPNGVVFEAARRLDEWELIRRSFPTPRDFLRVERPPEKDEIEDRDAQHLLELIDGTRDLDHLAQEFYLSRFDLYRILRDLVEAGIVRSQDADELKRRAGSLCEREEFLRAIPMLESAHGLEPEDAATLRMLAEACQVSGDAGGAAAWLVRLAQQRYRDGNVARAAERARQATGIDERNLEAIELLALVALKSGEPAEAVELTCRRVSILRERKEYNVGAEVCEEILAIPECESLELRVHLGSCHAASRRPSEAIEAFHEAAGLAERQGRARELIEILKRILALDPGSVEANQKIQALQGVEVRRRRRRVGILIGGAVLLVISGIALLAVGRGDDFNARMAQSRGLMHKEEFDEAQKLAEQLKGGLDDDDERVLEVENLLAEIHRRRARHAGPGHAESQEISARFEEHVKAAVGLFKSARVLEGFRELYDAAELLDGEKGLAKALKLEAPERYGKLRGDHLRTVRETGRTGLEDVLKLIPQDREAIDLIRRRGVIKAGDNLEKELERVLEIRNRTFDLELIGKAVIRLQERAGEDKVLQAVFERLVEADPDVAQTRRLAEEVEHTIRAQMLRPKILRKFRLGMTAGQKALTAGFLEDARRAFEDVLEYFREVERLRPQEPYASLVDLIRGQGLWTQAEEARRGVEGVLESLARAHLYLEERREGEAWRIYVDVLVAHPDIDFREHIRLPLRLTSRPPGAQVTLNEKLVGQTPLRVDLPYSGRSEIVVSLPTFQRAELTIDGAQDEGGALRHLDLDKIPRWNRDLGSPFGPTTAVVAGRLLLAGRDGKVFVLDPAMGEEETRFDTGLLEGFAAPPATDGDRAWLVAAAGEVRRVDFRPAIVQQTLDIRADGKAGAAFGGGRLYVLTAAGRIAAYDGEAIRWSVNLPGRVIDAPLLTQGKLLVSTISGHVLALSAATGKVLWKRDVGAPVRHAPWRSGRRVVVGQDAGVILSLDIQTGQPVWRQRIPSAVSTRPVVAYGIVHVGALDGRVHRLSASNGNPIDALEVGGPIHTELVIRAGRLYVGTRTGRACAFDLQRRALLWSFDLGSAAVGRPLVLEDSVVFVSQRGRVVAFE